MGETDYIKDEYFNSIDNVMLIVGKDFTIEKINKKGQKFVDKKKEVAVGSKCYKILHDKDEPCKICPFGKKEFKKNPKTVYRDENILNKYFSVKHTPILNENGLMTKFVLLIQDISQQGETEQKNRLLAAIVDSSHDAIIGKTVEGTITSWNAGAEEMYGYTEKECIGKNISLLIPRDRQDEYHFIMEKICKGEKIDFFETVRKTKNSGIIDVSLTISPIKEDDGRVIGASTIARNITRNKEIEKEKNHLICTLNERVKELDFLYNVSKLSTNYEHSLHDIFQETANLIPFSLHYPEIACDRIVFDDEEYKTKNFLETSLQQSSDIVISGKKRGFIQVCYLKGKTDVKEVVFLKEEKNLITNLGRQLALIADRRQREEQITFALKEKETLLKEVHHRVKNNLQIISAMLKLQSDSIVDLEALEKFKETCNRIQSIALIHEQLYNSNTLSEIHFKDYITKLTSDMIHSYKEKANTIDLICNCHDVTLNVNIAIPCALIINELVLNSFKHAFEGDQKGIISIVLMKKKENHFKLIVRDNGKGLPKPLNLTKPSSLGLQLVNNLVKQLKGSINYYFDEGAVFEIGFLSNDDQKNSLYKGINDE